MSAHDRFVWRPGEIELDPRWTPTARTTASLASGCGPPGGDHHVYSVDTDRCTCGGVVTYFEDGDRNGEIGEGCEVADLVFPPKCAICGERITGDKAEMYAVGTPELVLVAMDGPSIVHPECGLANGWEIA